jgi:hypothetical protein
LFKNGTRTHIPNQKKKQETRRTTKKKESFDVNDQTLGETNLRKKSNLHLQKDPYRVFFNIQKTTKKKIKTRRKRVFYIFHFVSKVPFFLGSEKKNKKKSYVLQSGTTKEHFFVVQCVMCGEISSPAF